MKKIIAAFAGNRVFANLVLAIFFVGAALAVHSMIRETLPTMSVDIITVTVPYPGADPEEVEEGICRKLEDAIENVDGVKSYGTVAHENYGQARIEVKETYDVQTVLDRVRSRIDSISTFPPDAERPIVTEILKQEYVSILALSGNLPEKQLKELAADIKDEIQALPKVNNVILSGIRDYEISIEIPEPKLRQYGLSLNDVAAAVKHGSLNMAGGDIRTRGETIRVRTIGRKYRAAEFARIPVSARPDGTVITLGEIADIKDGFTQDPIVTSVDGKPAAFITILKNESQDSIKISNSVKKYIKQRQATLPPGVELSEVIDLSVFLRGRINLLLRNGLMGLTFVFLLLWLFLDLRLSFWAAMGMPTSVAGALIVLWWTGGTINMISLFALIMVLGIIVDDAIVIGEAIYVHHRSGKPPLQAAVDGVAEVGMPVVASVTTTIVAFIPLMYVGGVMGNFIRILPKVVIACLTVSLIECIILLPAHLGDLKNLDETERHKGIFYRFFRAVHHFTGGALERFTAGPYARFIAMALRNRYTALSIAVAVLLAALGLIRGGILKFEVFPNLDGFVTTCRIDFPDGTPPDKIQQAVEHIADAARQLNRKIADAGRPAPVHHILSSAGETLGDVPQQSPHLGSVQAILTDSKHRDITSDDFMLEWEKFAGQIPGARAVSYQGMNVGPPGAPIEIWISGRNMKTILQAADELQARLKKFEGVHQVQSDFRAGKTELRLTLKPEAATLGITLADLALAAHASWYGNEALRIQRGRDDIRVKIRHTATERSELADIRQFRIKTRDGRKIPLLAVANVEFAPGYAAIRREDGFRNVSVTARLNTRKANATEIFGELVRGYFPQLKQKYPGISVKLQGEKKKMRESLSTLLVGFPLAILGIYIIIAAMFRSYIQPFVILFTVPFGIIGAILGHLAMGLNLTMMSLFGIVALSGIVVNDAIVLIECINENLADGMSFLEAVQQGAVRRVRAVLLTTLSTVGGLAPLILEKDEQARFLIPMALSIAAGVAFATLLTLVLIPSLLAILNDARRLVFRLKHGSWPAREEVEPARLRRQSGECIT